MGEPSATTGSGVTGWPEGIGRGLVLRGGGGASPAPAWSRWSRGPGWRRGCLRSPGKRRLLGKAPRAPRPSRGPKGGRTGPSEGQIGPGWRAASTPPARPRLAGSLQGRIMAGPKGPGPNGGGPAWPGSGGSPRPRLARPWMPRMSPESCLCLMVFCSRKCLCSSCCCRRGWGSPTWGGT